MRTGGVKIIAGSIQVDRKEIDGIESILLTVGLGLYQEHFFRETIGGIGLLRIPVPEILLPEGHGCELGVGTDRADNHAFFDPLPSRGLDDLNPHEGIIVEEGGRVLPVESDPAHFTRQVDNDILPRHRMFAVLPFPKVSIPAPWNSEIGGYNASPLQLLHQVGAEKACTTGDEDLFVLPEIHFVNPMIDPLQGMNAVTIT